MREGERLGRLIKLANQAFEKTKNALLEDHDITSSQADVLDFLRSCEDGMATQKEITAYLHASYATVSGLVVRLEEKGMVERVPFEADRRSHLVRMTNKARPLVGTCAVELEAMDERVLEGFSDEERMQLVEMLKRLVNNAQSDGAKPVSDDWEGDGA